MSDAVQVRGPFAVNFLCAVFMVGGVGGGDRLGLIVLGLAPLWARTERAGSNLARVGLAPRAPAPPRRLIPADRDHLEMRRGVIACLLLMRMFG